MAAGRRTNGATSICGRPTAMHIGPRVSLEHRREEGVAERQMNPQHEDFICFYREAVIAGHDAPAAETMRRFNLSRDYTIRLLNGAIAGCDGQDIRNWNPSAKTGKMRTPVNHKRTCSDAMEPTILR
jgi:hypothetical protein